MTITNVQLHMPYSVTFDHEGKSFDYIIDRGGLQRGPFPIHCTPNGHMHFDPSCSFEDIKRAARELGARISVVL